MHFYIFRKQNYQSPMDDFSKELENLKKENEKLRDQINKTNSKQQKKQENRKKTLSWTWKMFTGKNLNKSFNQFFVEYHSERKVQPDTSANLLTAIVSRFIRVRTLSLILLLFSLVPSLISLWVLIKQNSLIQNQNSLVEASRKSSYGFQLANVFDAVDKNQYSNSLKGRIVGLSHTLKPYHILDENGELSENLYSPERSQLLLFLVNSNIGSNGLRSIFESADFSHCDLRNMNLSGRYLGNVNLSNSNLSGANLTKANLTGADLTGVNMNNVKFTEGIAKKADFTKALITSSDLRYADLSGSNLKSSNLSNANLSFGTFKNVCFTDTKMNDTNLNEANLEQAYFKGSFYLDVDNDNNKSERYIENKYRIKNDDDGFDTFVTK